MKTTLGLSAKTSLLATALTVALASTASGASLLPGQSHTVVTGDTPEAWTLTGARLTVLDGQTLSINATRTSTVTLSGAEVTGNAIFGAIRLGNSQADIQNSVLTNTFGRALTLAVEIGASLTASEAVVRGSTLVGLGVGASISTRGAGQRANLSVDASSIEGLADGAPGLSGGNGLLLLGTADVMVANGSSIVGDRDGIYALETDENGASNVVIDASRVEGRGGSAIHVAPSRTSTSPVTKAVFTVQNNGELLGGDGNLLLVDAADATVGLNITNSQLSGNIVNSAGSTVAVLMSNGAQLTGSTDQVTSMGLQNARWQLNGNSSVGTLSLGQGAEVALGDGTAFHALTVTDNYDGNGGTLLFNTVLAGDDASSDKLVIGGDTSGQTNVRVNNVGGIGAQTVNGIELITVAGASNGQFDLAGRAVGGQYDYFLFKQAGNWYLRSQLPTAPDPCDADPSLPECGGGVGPVDPVDPVDPVVPPPVLRPEGGAYLANLQASQSMFRLGYHDRHADLNNGRAWARVDGSRTGFDAVSRQLDVQGNSQSLSVGADLWRNEAGSGVGVMLSSGNASSTSTNPLSGYYARGKVKGEALGVYGTLRAHHAADPYAGFYLDGSLQRAQFRNRVEGVALATERYDSRGWQGALETGYAFRVGGPQNGGIFLEPQLQLGYNRWDDLRHTEANGTIVTAQDADGLYGRLGLRLSGVTRWSNGGADVQPYIAANWLHTRAESQVWMDDERVDARIPRSRAEVSAGASLKFANGFGAWAGLARQQASGYRQTSAQLGMSYRW